MLEVESTYAHALSLSLLSPLPLLLSHYLLALFLLPSAQDAGPTPYDDRPFSFIFLSMFKGGAKRLVRVSVARIMVHEVVHSNLAYIGQ